MSIIGRLIRFGLERGARGKSYAELTERLAREQESVAQRMAQAADTPRNRAVAAHIIGIERWGQRRLRTLLGEPLLHDEYDGYRPSGELAPAALAEEFRATRQATVALAQELAAAGADLNATVPHNDAGPMRAGGWLNYLNMHASMEAKRLRPS